MKRAFVFGHYDSRGGTVAVVHNDGDVAARRYACWFWSGETGEPSEDWFESEGSDVVADDFLGEALLECPEVPSGDDLADHGFEVLVRVDALEDEARRDWEESDEPVSPSEIDWEREVHLRAFPSDVLAAAGWARVEWADDAFSFVVLR